MKKKKIPEGYIQCNLCMERLQSGEIMSDFYFPFYNFIVVLFSTFFIISFDTRTKISFYANSKNF